MGGIADLLTNPEALNLQNLSPAVQVALLLGLSMIDVLYNAPSLFR